MGGWVGVSLSFCSYLPTQPQHTVARSNRLLVLYPPTHPPKQLHATHTHFAFSSPSSFSSLLLQAEQKIKEEKAKYGLPTRRDLPSSLLLYVGGWVGGWLND